jgi:hypothetical protein
LYNSKDNSRPDWWGPKYTEPEKKCSSEPVFEDRPKGRVSETIKKENLSVILDNLVSTIDLQKSEINELEYSLKIEKKNSKILLQKISELEDINANLKTILKTVGDKDIKALVDPPVEEESVVIPHLFISKDAPKELFNAVYRAAIKIYHPDNHDGNEEIMKTINVIKDELYKSKGWS